MFDSLGGDIFIYDPILPAKDSESKANLRVLCIKMIQDGVSGILGFP